MTTGKTRLTHAHSSKNVSNCLGTHGRRRHAAHTNFERRRWKQSNLRQLKKRRDSPKGAEKFTQREKLPESPTTACAHARTQAGRNKKTKKKEEHHTGDLTNNKHTRTTPRDPAGETRCQKTQRKEAETANKRTREQENKKNERPRANAQTKPRLEMN